jgi:aryl-alcohol dehydrogenase-like predicted oxidoreductase
LAGGLLSGKFRRDAEQPENSRHLSEEWNEPPVRNEDRLYDTIEVLVDVAKAHGVSAAQVALAWLRGRPGVTSRVIVGARTDEQLADNLAAADLVLSSEERGALDRGEHAGPDLPALAPGRDRQRPPQRPGPGPPPPRTSSK